MHQIGLLIDPPKPSATPFPWEVAKRCYVSFIFKTDCHSGNLDGAGLDGKGVQCRTCKILYGVLTQFF